MLVKCLEIIILESVAPQYHLVGFFRFNLQLILLSFNFKFTDLTLMMAETFPYVLRYS